MIIRIAFFALLFLLSTTIEYHICHGRVHGANDYWKRQDLEKGIMLFCFVRALEWKLGKFSF